MTAATMRMVAVAGGCGTLLGVGLQRFAYAPLVPAMLQQGWLTASEAGLLGAVNFAGYVAGGVTAAMIARRLGLVATLRLAMVTATGCFVLCAARWGVAWLSPWRFLAGFAGGVLMVLIGPAVQRAVPAERRGLAAGIVFTGVGLGIVGGAVIVPVALPAGIAAIWLALAAAGLALTALSWRFWPDGPAPPPSPPGGRLAPGGVRLVASYALAAVAATPHMVWWPDFIARGLGHGTRWGAASWVVYGLGALAGPSLCGRLADRFGAYAALRVILGAQAIAIGAPVLTANPGCLAAGAIVAGAGAVGTTVLALTRAREIAGEDAPVVWRLSTISWGMAQVATGFVLVWLFAQTGSHLALFGLGAAAALAALLIA